MLTDLQIRSAKPSDKNYPLTDANGLRLMVTVSGSKLWQYRFRFQGKENIGSLGQYPEVSLGEARQARDGMRKLLSRGINPNHEKRLAKTPGNQDTSPSFEEVANEWLEHWRKECTPRHHQYGCRRLKRLVFPAIGTRPIAEVSTQEVVQVVLAIANRGDLDLAGRMWSHINQIYRFAVARGLAPMNPAAQVRRSDVLPSPRRTHYARIDARELPDLVRAIESYRGTPLTKMALQLMALTFVRTKELIGAKWEEIDLAEGLWRIPAERMKMRNPHIVPLARQTVDLLVALKDFSGAGEYLFPSAVRRGVHMSNNTLTAALGRMGYKGLMTGHGFRGLASTVLHEQGFDHQHIELQLAHQQRNQVSAAYNHALYVQPRREMMQWWADFVSTAANKGS